MTGRRRVNVRCGDSRAALRTALAALLGLFVAAHIADASPRESPRIASLGIGVAGVYRTDRWCPVEVRVADVDADGEFMLEIDAGDPSDRIVNYRSSVRLLAKVENRVAQLVRLGGVGRSNAQIVARLRDAGGTIVAERSFALADLAEPLEDDESLVPIVGRLSGLDAVEYRRGHEHHQAVFRQLTSLAQLPAVGWQSLTDRTLALDAVDTVVWLAGQSPDDFNEERDARHVELLDDWVRGGGRLILSLGPHASQSFANGPTLRRMNVAIQSESSELRQIAPLETFVGDAAIASGRPNAGRSDARPFRLPIVQLAAGDGKTVAAAGQSAAALPLVVRMPHGFGEIVVVAFDLGDEALAAWPGRARLSSKIFALGESDESSTPVDRPLSAAWSAKAYESLSEQLADALDQFPGASPSRFWYLAAAALGYILVIGPLDRYVVRRKPEWTWATFLATVAVVAVGAYYVVRATKADAPLVNQLCFIDVDLTASDATDTDATADAASRSGRRSTARTRGTAWTCLYQPSAAVVDVAMTTPSLGRRIAVDDAASSLTLPDARLALWDRSTAVVADGLLSRSIGDGVGRRGGGLACGDGGRISSLARPAWSSQHIIGDWIDGTAMPFVAGLTADAFGRVVGQVQNPLDEPLEKSVLLYGSYALSLGSLDPGQTVDVDGRGEWRSTEAYLTRQRLNEDRETAQRYNSTEFDLDRIGEVIGFYEASGGKQYVGLDRRNLERLDLTEQLRLGRAVLIGKARSGVRVSISPSDATDAEGEHSDFAATDHLQTTWWRFLIRVADVGPSAR